MRRVRCLPNTAGPAAAPTLVMRARPGGSHRQQPLGSPQLQPPAPLCMGRHVIFGWPTELDRGDDLLDDMKIFMRTCEPVERAEAHMFLPDAPRKKTLIAKSEDPARRPQTALASSTTTLRAGPLIDCRGPTCCGTERCPEQGAHRCRIRGDADNIRGMCSEVLDIEGGNGDITAKDGAFVAMLNRSARPDSMADR